MSAVNIHCALGLNLFFHSAIYNHECAYLSLKNSTPLQLTSAQWPLFRLWRLKKEEIEAFVHTAPLRNLQLRGEFWSRLLLVKNDG
jgi:hypothetical protein